MKGSTILCIVLFIILIGVGLFFYFYKQLPAENEVVSTVNFNVYTFEVNPFLERKQIENNYSILIDNNYYKDGITSVGGAILEKIQMNHTVLFYTKYADNNYYSDYQVFSTFNKSNNENIRVELNLVRRGNLSVEQYGIFGENNPIIVNFTTDSEFRNIIICFKWGIHTVYVSTNNTLYLSEQTPLNNNDKCFLTDITIYQNKTLEIPVYYKNFGILDYYDFINIGLYDSSYNYQNKIYINNNSFAYQLK